MKKTFMALILFLFLATSCFAEEFTLGMVQKTLHTGMPQSDVVSCLGSPNMVTKNAEGCETWVYDKVSKSTSETYHKSWLWLIFFGRRKGCQKTETSEKTINVVLNFDKNSCLEYFTYKASSF